MKKIYLNTLKPEEIIARLKNGEVVKSIDDEDFLCKMTDGIIVKKYETEMSIGSAIIVDERNDFYFEEEEKFEVDSTGLYLTKNRLKAFVSRIDDDKAQGIIEGGFSKSYWDKTGKYMNNKIPEFDLVGKWEE